MCFLDQPRDQGAITLDGQVKMATTKMAIIILATSQIAILISQHTPRIGIMDDSGINLKKIIRGASPHLKSDMELVQINEVGRIDDHC